MKAQPRTLPKKQDDMTQRRKTSHVGTTGSLAGSMSSVNNNREETTNPSSRMRCDEEHFKRPDCPYLKNGRTSLKLDTWNVRTLNQLGKLENLQKEVDNLQMDILSISEARYIGEEGKVRLDGYTFIYSGGDEHQHGFYPIADLMPSTKLATEKRHS